MFLNTYFKAGVLKKKGGGGKAGRTRKTGCGTEAEASSVAPTRAPRGKKRERGRGKQTVGQNETIGGLISPRLMGRTCIIVAYYLPGPRGLIISFRVMWRSDGIGGCTVHR